MSNGQVLDLGSKTITVLLLDAQVSVSSGIWVSAFTIMEKTFITSGLESGGTIQIHASNSFAKPLDSVDGAVIQNITTNNGLTDAFVWRWLKAKKSIVGGTPTPSTVILCGRIF